MSIFTNAEADALSLDGLVNDNALVSTRRNGPKPSYQFLVDGWNAEFAAKIIEINKSRGFRVVGTFATGFTYELLNDVGIDASGNSWIYTGADALPKAITAGTVPSSPDFQQVTYNDHSGLVNLNSEGGHDEIYARSVNSLKSLVAYTPALVDGQKFDVTGFYANTKVGGGLFIWDASRPKTEHNGGTVIAPEALTAWDGSALNLSQLLNWTGTGSGCWIRTVDAYIHASWFGLTAGYSFCKPVQKAIDVAHSSGGMTVAVTPTGSPSLLDENLYFKQGTKLIGVGFDRLFASDDAKGCAVKRTIANVGIIIDGTIDGERLRWCTIQDISVDGGDLDGDLFIINKVQNFMFNRVQTSWSKSRAVYIKDMYDSWFYDSYIQRSGGLTYAAFEMDDSSGGNNSTTNNVRFSGMTWEGNYGRPIYIHGKGTGPGNTQISFVNKCKVENVDVNDYMIVIEDAGGINFESTLLVTKGTAGNVIPAQILIKDSRNIRGSFDGTHNSGGASLTSVVKLDGYARCDLELYPSTTFIDNITSNFIFDNSTGSYDNVSKLHSIYIGSKSLVTNNGTSYTQIQPLGVDTPSPVGITIRRNGGTDSNTSMQYTGSASGSVVTGKNAAGEFVVGTLSDLSAGQMVKFRRDGVQVYYGETHLTVGLAGGAADLPIKPSGYMSIEVGGLTRKIPFYNE